MSAGIAFWFAPKPAVEQAVHLGAFVSHGTVRVGDKYIMYGLSKGAVADVRTSGRICLLDLDLAVRTMPPGFMLPSGDAEKSLVLK